MSASNAQSTTADVIDGISLTGKVALDHAVDPSQAERLWELSEQLVGQTVQ